MKIEVENVNNIVIPMSEMKTGEIGTIVRCSINAYIGRTVMRFKSSVMDMESLDGWNYPPDTIFVSLLPKGSTVTLTVE